MKKNQKNRGAEIKKIMPSVPSQLSEIQLSKFTGLNARIHSAMRSVKKNLQPCLDVENKIFIILDEMMDLMKKINHKGPDEEKLKQAFNLKIVFLSRKIVNFSNFLKLNFKGNFLALAEEILSIARTDKNIMLANIQMLYDLAFYFIELEDNKKFNIQFQKILETNFEDIDLLNKENELNYLLIAKLNHLINIVNKKENKIIEIFSKAIKKTINLVVKITNISPDEITEQFSVLIYNLVLITKFYLKIKANGEAKKLIEDINIIWKKNLKGKQYEFSLNEQLIFEISKMIQENQKFLEKESLISCLNEIVSFEEALKNRLIPLDSKLIKPHKEIVKILLETEKNKAAYEHCMLFLNDHMTPIELEDLISASLDVCERYKNIIKANGNALDRVGCIEYLKKLSTKCKRICLTDPQRQKLSPNLLVKVITFVTENKDSADDHIETLKNKIESTYNKSLETIAKENKEFKFDIDNQAKFSKALQNFSSNLENKDIDLICDALMFLSYKMSHLVSKNSDIHMAIRANLMTGLEVCNLFSMKYDRVFCHQFDFAMGGIIHVISLRSFEDNEYFNFKEMFFSIPWKKENFFGFMKNIVAIPKMCLSELKAHSENRVKLIELIICSAKKVMTEYDSFDPNMEILPLKILTTETLLYITDSFLNIYVSTSEDDSYKEFFLKNYFLLAQRNLKILDSIEKATLSEDDKIQLFTAILEFLKNQCNHKDVLIDNLKNKLINLIDKLIIDQSICSNDRFSSCIAAFNLLRQPQINSSDEQKLEHSMSLAVKSDFLISDAGNDLDINKKIDELNSKIDSLQKKNLKMEAELKQVRGEFATSSIKKNEKIAKLKGELKESEEKKEALAQSLRDESSKAVQMVARNESLVDQLNKNKNCLAIKQKECIKLQALQEHSLQEIKEKDLEIARLRDQIAQQGNDYKMQVSALSDHSKKKEAEYKLSKNNFISQMNAQRAADYVALRKKALSIHGGNAVLFLAESDPVYKGPPKAKF